MGRPIRSIRTLSLVAALIVGSALLIGDASRLIFADHPATGSLRILSDPPGAAVSVDGQPFGVTPLQVKRLQAGDHRVRLSLLRYQDHEETVKVREGGETRVDVELKAAPATLHVTTYPQGGRIEVDGKTVGKSEWTGAVPAGEHTILVSLQKHVPEGETVKLLPGEERTVEVVLLEGTPIDVPMAGAVPLLRRSDRLFQWPRKGDAKGRDDAPMMLVPAGEFVMGSADADLQAYATEKPQHRVRLSAFYIDRFEVTNAQYHKFLVDLADRKDDVHRDCDPSEPANKSHTPGLLSMWGREWNGSRQPVVEVDWWDAAAYCYWAGRRLPTEAEWEKAARGTDARPYPWGDDPPGAFAQGNFADLTFVERNPDWTWIVPRYDDGHAWTSPIGSYPRGASPYGAEDMAGNVWEWVRDWFAGGYYKDSPAENPQGPPMGTYRAVRGGSWNDIAWDLRSASRLKLKPGFRVRTVGFRCARDAD